MTFAMPFCVRAYHSTHFPIAVCLSALFAGSPSLRGQTTDPATSGDTNRPRIATYDPQVLQELVESYFRSDVETERARIGERIEGVDGVTLDAVEGAVRSATLWQTRPSGLDAFEVSSGHGDAVSVHVHVPPNYDPANAYPLLLALHGQGGRGEDYIHFAMRLLGDRVNEFLVAAPTDYKGCWFGSSLGESYLPSAIIEGLKRRYHVDTDRVYVNGYSMGGHGSFLHAVLYTDYFAASIPLAGSFITQVGEEGVEVMLPNVAHLPMLVVWGEMDREDSARKFDAASGISGSNRFVRRVAERLDIPIDMVELPGLGHHGVLPPTEKFQAMLRQVRPHDLRAFTHWFRYPAQGRLCWLRQRRYQGLPWKGNRFVVRTKGNESYSEAAIRVLKNRLALLKGSIDGQRIDIETRRCEEIDVLLHEGLVDLNRDIQILLKGKEVFRGWAEPSIRTLLDVAYQDWDFQRLFPVRFRITRTGKVDRG